MKQKGMKFIQRILHKFRCKKGFTLIEMVMATALVAIFFTMAAAVLPAWFHNYKTIINLSYARQISNSIVAAVESQMMFAEGVDLLNGTDNTTIIGKKGATTIKIPERRPDGTIEKIEGLVYDDHFFRGLDVDMQFTVDKGNYCNMVITVKDADGSKILEKTRSIKLAGKSA